MNGPILRCSTLGLPRSGAVQMTAHFFGCAKTAPAPWTKPVFYPNQALNIRPAYRWHVARFALHPDSEPALSIEIP